MIYTSGTTGMPKGVRRAPWAPEAMAARQRSMAQCFGMSPDAPVRTVITGPMYHVVPNICGLTAALYDGLVVLQPRFDAEQLLALIERHGINAVHLVPTMFVRLLRLPEAVRERYDLSSLKFVCHGAAPCPPDVKRRMIDWLGPIVHEYYGATESGAVFYHDSHEALRKPGTVGRTVEGGRVEIHDAAGNALPTGEIGEIYLRLAHWPDFTYHNNDAKRREIERDGLITIGDMGYLDEDGYLFLCDRANDMVISGGVNIYPAEIEAVLIDMPGVHDCAVFGIPDEEFGESLCAYVEPLDGAPLDAGAVRAYLKERIANYKVPKVVEFSADLPREDTGKIFKRRLREPYWRDAGRNI
jgi:long-chain acyl-CoA synthetase